MSAPAPANKGCPPLPYVRQRPPRPSSSIQDFDQPIYLGNDLKNRLATFALGHGAVSVRFETTRGMPTMVVLSDGGPESHTVLSGTAAGWHRALDTMALLNDEDISAGLHRTLRIHQGQPQSNKQVPDVTLANRYSESQIAA
jgi:hypothetical protein